MTWCILFCSLYSSTTLRSHSSPMSAPSTETHPNQRPTHPLYLLPWAQRTETRLPSSACGLAYQSSRCSCDAIIRLFSRQNQRNLMGLWSRGRRFSRSTGNVQEISLRKYLRCSETLREKIRYLLVAEGGAVWGTPSGLSTTH